MWYSLRAPVALEREVALDRPPSLELLLLLLLEREAGDTSTYCGPACEFPAFECPACECLSDGGAGGGGGGS